MSYLFRTLLTFTSTSWMLIIYKIKSSIKFTTIPVVVEDLVCISLLLFATLLSLQLMRALPPETCDKCDSFTLVDKEFIPVYLG